MQFKYTEAPNDLSFVGWLENLDLLKKGIFLAGSITGARNWQQIASRELIAHLSVFNPRRESFDVTKEDESKKQIDWEYNYLHRVKIIMFWFSNETLAPITLFELGAALERKDQKIYVGCDPEYKRKFDVTYQCGKFGVKVEDSLENLINAIKLDNPIKM